MQEASEELIQKFRSPAYPGSLFLSFEGIEGAGKSSQLKRTTEYLEKKGYRVLVLREPGGTTFGERLRKAILETSKDLHPLAEAHLFASARAQLLYEVIMKELEVAGTAIICDRYIDSSLAYQGIGRNLGFKTILTIHENFPLNLVPHLTFYFKIDVETSYSRQKMRNAPKDYFESQGSDFYQKLIDGYDKAAEMFPGRIKTIDGNREMGPIFEDVRSLLDQLILATSTSDQNA
ncbi:MAG: dTMP kinase [Bacteriovoracaceae bacterium]|nr:dTMP kinase [Bacteriovoracaceae bacterium]